MPFKRHLLTAVAFALCASLGRAAVPSKHEVLQAIAVMEKSISGPQAVEAAKTIVVYAQSSDDVLVNIGPDELPWLDEDWGLGGEREQSAIRASWLATNALSHQKAASVKP
jgi:hypothetical protein